MTDVDRIYEAALADDWEEQNKSERDNFPKWDEAIKKLQTAKAAVVAAVSMIFEASALVEESTQEDRIASIGMDIDENATALYRQIERMVKA